MKAKKYDEESYNKPFPKRLRALLDNEDGISPLDKIVTQTELAQAFSDNGMPVTRQTISLYANGETKPDYEKFKFIADFFQVSYDFLLGETEAIRRQNIDIYEQTGLTDDTIDALKLMKLSADGVVSELSIEDEIRAKYALLVLNRIFAWNNIVSITGPICDYFRSKIKFDVRMEAISNSDEMELQNEHYDLFGEDLKRVRQLYKNESTRETILTVIKDDLKFHEWRVSDVFLKVVKEVTQRICANPDIMSHIVDLESILEKAEAGFENTIDIWRSE